MSVRIAYDDPADPMDPAMEGHAEQLRRIDAEDARRHQAREAEHTPPHSDGSRPPVAEGPSSAGGRPLQTPGAPDTPTPPRARGGVVADPLALLAEVERERELRDSWYERCRDAEAERNVQRMRAEKAEFIACAFAVPAVRYAIGRRTYAVSDVCQGVGVLLSDLAPSQIGAIIREIDAAHDLGAPHDRDHWMELRSKCAKHLQREAA